MTGQQLLVLAIIASLSDNVITHTRHHRVNLGSHLTHRNVPEAKANFTPAPQSMRQHRDVCEEDGICVLPVQCPAHVRDEDKHFCTVIGGRKGVCCTSGQNHTG